MPVFSSGKKLSQDQMAEVIKEFYSAMEWPEKKKLFEMHYDTLTSEVTQNIFSNMAQQAESYAMATYAVMHLVLIGVCQEKGVEAADTVAFSAGSIDAAWEFFNADTWDEGKQVIKQHSDWLLAESIDATFEVMSEILRGLTPAMGRKADRHLEVLVRCRQEEVDAVFADAGRLPDKGVEDMSFRETAGLLLRGAGANLLSKLKGEE